MFESTLLEMVLVANLAIVLVLMLAYWKNIYGSNSQV